MHAHPRINQGMKTQPIGARRSNDHLSPFSHDASAHVSGPHVESLPRLDQFRILRVGIEDPYIHIDRGLGDVNFPGQLNGRAMCFDQVTNEHPSGAAIGSAHRVHDDVQSRHPCTLFNIQTDFVAV